MNKFIDKKETVSRKKKAVETPKEKQIKAEIVTKGTKQFLICPKCGWQHPFEEEKCRFCGQTLRG